MDEHEELRRLRGVVRDAAHDLSNALGIALNYAAFLREDLDGGDPAEPADPAGAGSPARAALGPIESALHRATESVRLLRAEVAPEDALPGLTVGSAQEQVGPDRAQDRQHD